MIQTTVWSPLGFATLSTPSDTSSNILCIQLPWGTAYISKPRIKSSIRLTIMAIIPPSSSKLISSMKTLEFPSLPVDMSFIQLKELIALEINQSEYAIDIIRRGKKINSSDSRFDEAKISSPLLGFKDNDILMAMTSSNFFYSAARTLSFGITKCLKPSISQTLSSFVQRSLSCSLTKLLNELHGSIYFSQLKQKTVQILKLIQSSLLQQESTSFPHLSIFEDFTTRAEMSGSESELIYVSIAALWTVDILTDRFVLLQWISKCNRVRWGQGDQENVGKIMLAMIMMWKNFSTVREDDSFEKSIATKGVKNTMLILASLSKSESNTETTPLEEEIGRAKSCHDLKVALHTLKRHCVDFDMLNGRWTDYVEMWMVLLESIKATDRPMTGTNSNKFDSKFSTIVKANERITKLEQRTLFGSIFKAAEQEMSAEALDAIVRDLHFVTNGQNASGIFRMPANQNFSVEERRTRQFTLRR